MRMKLGAWKERPLARSSDATLYCDCTAVRMDIQGTARILVVRAIAALRRSVRRSKLGSGRCESAMGNHDRLCVKQGIRIVIAAPLCNTAHAR